MSIKKAISGYRDGFFFVCIFMSVMIKILKYRDFYKMAVYANENWKAGLSNEELACSAYSLFYDYKYRLEKK